MQLYLLKHISVMCDQMFKFIFVIMIGSFTSRYVLNSLVIKFRNESSNFQLIIKMHTA